LTGLYHLFPGLKKQLKASHFSPDKETIPAAETWLDGQRSEYFLSDLQNLEQRDMSRIAALPL
jgi:hypothetical protein